MGKGHKKAHALWAAEGRPADFSTEKCATDDVFGDTAKTAAIEKGMDQLRKEIWG